MNNQPLDLEDSIDDYDSSDDYDDESDDLESDDLESLDQDSIESQEDTLANLQNSLEEMKCIMMGMFIIMIGMFLWILTKMDRVETFVTNQLELITNRRHDMRDVYILVTLWIVWKVLCVSYDKISSWYAERKGKRVSWCDKHNE
jgi:uncharacterized membrane protein (DUF106 family)